MADTDNTGGEDAVSAGEEGAAPAEKPAAKKKAAKKKVVAKKGAKKATAKKAASKKAATKKVAASSPKPATAAPAQSAPPVWDDTADEDSLLHWCVKLGPVVLLIILMIVLGSSEPTAQTTTAVDSKTITTDAAPSIDTSSSLAATSNATTPGAVPLSSDYDPWASLPLDLNDLSLGGDDPGAFYWGAPLINEAPPAPSTD